MELLTVEHGIDFYPAKIFPYANASPLNATNPEDFSQTLAKVFASEQVKKIIRSLLAQSKQ